MVLLPAVCLCCLGLALVGPALAMEEPKVQTNYGWVQGGCTTTRGGRKIFEFLGIPYAKAPLKELRFQSPQPPEKWSGVRPATQEGPACIQQLVVIEAVRDNVTGSEDCLYLNVYTPRVEPAAKLPVVVYIHGGAYMGMSDAKARYGPHLLLDKDVILVTMKYRTGVMGFLTTEDEVMPGNYHMKDQVASMKWVKENIQHFGGDPSSITLFGESSGAASVTLHMLSPSSKGLFHRAIVHSGNVLSPWGHSEPGELKKRAEKVAQLVGCPFSPSADFLACLQKLPAEKIVATNKQFLVWDLDPVVFWNPTIEKSSVKDAFLTESPWKLTSDVPLLTGFNYAEGGIKTCSVLGGDVKQKFKQWNDDFENLTPISLLYDQRAPDPAAVTKAVRKYYFNNADKITPDMEKQITDVYSDFWFNNGVLDFAQRHKGTKYLYHYIYNTSVSLCSVYWNNPKVHLRACHLDDLRNLFPMDGYYAKPDEKDRYDLSLKMIEMWTNFAKNSVPTGGGVTWNPVVSDALEYLQISNSGFAMMSHPIQERREFYKSLQVRKSG